MKAITLAILLGFIGLGVGYGIFAQINGNYVDLDIIFTKKTGILENLASSACGIDDMRTEILGCGACGAILELLLGAIPTGGNKE